MLFLTEEDVYAALDGLDVYKEAIGVIEEIFRHQATGEATRFKRITLEHPDRPGHLWHNIRILPGMVPGVGAAGVRVYSGHQGSNRSEIICLFDWNDMGMSAVISDYYLHTIRTSAPYGAAVKHLARPDAGKIGIIGTGRLARGQVRAACAVRDIVQIKAYSRSAENRRKFCEEMEAALGVEAVPVETGREAVEGADIMITSTSGNTIVFEGDWLEPGVLFMSVAPGEIDEETVLRSTRVILAATDQVLYDKPPRKPFPALLESGKFRRKTWRRNSATWSWARSRAASATTTSFSTSRPAWGFSTWAWRTGSTAWRKRTHRHGAVFRGGAQVSRARKTGFVRLDD